MSSFVCSQIIATPSKNIRIPSASRSLPLMSTACLINASAVRLSVSFAISFLAARRTSATCVAIPTTPLSDVMITLSFSVTVSNNDNVLDGIERAHKAADTGDLAAFVAEISSGVTTTVFNFIMLGLAGNTGVAAYGITANFAMVASSVFSGVANGSQPLISRAYGSAGANSDRQALGRLLKMCVVTTLAIAVVFIAAVYCFTDVFVGIFNSEGSAELAALGAQGIRLYFIGFLPAGLNIVLTGFLSASERAVPAFIAALMRGFAAIIGFAFALSALFGITGLWLAFPASETLTLIFAAAAVYRFMRKND